jgi:hypothetical protein
MPSRYAAGPDSRQPGLAGTESLSINKGTGRLVLAPADALQAPPMEALNTYLRDCGLLGEPLPGGRFRVGERFLQLITFMGCSPHIELEPPTHGGSFCHLRLLGPFTTARLLLGRNTQPPRCHACRSRVSRWQEQLPGWCERPAEPTVTCPRCGHRQRPVDLGWRQSGGFGRCFIQVEEVFPGEAVPVPGLIQGLRRISGCPWGYFYILD